LRAFPANPRKITERRLTALRGNLADLGDLGGIVENVAGADIAPQTGGQIVGGHQRLRAMFGERAGEFAVGNAEIEIVATYDPPTAQGTVAEGFIVWRGGRYAFRRVTWDDAAFRRANFVANTGAGQYDWDVFANTIDVADLTAWGVDPADWLRELNTDAGAVREMMQSDEQVDPVELWEGMPEFEQENMEGLMLTFHFPTQDDKEKFIRLTGLDIKITARSYWYPERPKELSDQFGTREIADGPISSKTAPRCSKNNAQMESLATPG
jgi:hypothetical protein